MKHKKFDPLTSLLLRIAGMDTEIAAECPERDITNGKSLAWLMLGVWSWQTALFTAVAHMMLAKPGAFRPELLATGMLLATIILLIDSYVIVRTSWSMQGLKELQRGGLRIPGMIGARLKNALFVVLRLAVTLGMAQLMALFLAILLFGKDIQADLDRRYRAANGPLIAKITEAVDQSIASLADEQKITAGLLAKAVADEGSLMRTSVDPTSDDPEVRLAIEKVSQLSSAKGDAEEELSAAQQFASDELAGIKGRAGNSGKAGNGPIRRAARERVTNAEAKVRKLTVELTGAEDRLSKLRLAGSAGGQERQATAQSSIGNAKVSREKLETRLKIIETALEDRRMRREALIREGVEADPSFVGLGNGFLANYQGLQRIAKEDETVIPVILLLDFVLFSIDLAAVLAKMATFIPAAYATKLAAEDYRRAHQQATDLARDVNEMQSPKDNDGDNTDAVSPVEPDAPPRRSSGGDAHVKKSEAARNEDAVSDVNAPSVQDDTTEPPRRKRGRPRRFTYKPDLSPPDSLGDEFPEEGEPLA